MAGGGWRSLLLGLVLAATFSHVVSETTAPKGIVSRILSIGGMPSTKCTADLSVGQCMVAFNNAQTCRLEACATVFAYDNKDDKKAMLVPLKMTDNKPSSVHDGYPLLDRDLRNTARKKGKGDELAAEFKTAGKSLKWTLAEQCSGREPFVLGKNS